MALIGGVRVSMSEPLLCCIMFWKQSLEIEYINPRLCQPQWIEKRCVERLEGVGLGLEEPTLTLCVPALAECAVYPIWSSFGGTLGEAAL